MRQTNVVSACPSAISASHRLVLALSIKNQHHGLLQKICRPAQKGGWDGFLETFPMLGILSKGLKQNGV